MTTVREDRVYVLEIAAKPILLFTANSLREAQSLLRGRVGFSTTCAI